MLGWRMPADAGLVTGKVVHNGMEVALNYKRVSGENMPIDDLLAAIEPYTKTKLERDKIPREEHQTVFDKSTRMIIALLQEHAEQIRTIEAVEERFSTTIEGVVVVGVIDAHADNELKDWKTTGKPPDQDAAFKNYQSEIYPIVYEDTPIRYIYVSDQPKAGTRVHERSIETQHELRQLADMAYESVRDIVRGIRAGSFPRRRDGWHCSQKWCPFFSDCILATKGMRPE